jgi:hypothetical protein
VVRVQVLERDLPQGRVDDAAELIAAGRKQRVGGDFDAAVVNVGKVPQADVEQRVVPADVLGKGRLRQRVQPLSTRGCAELE